MMFLGLQFCDLYNFKMKEFNDTPLAPLTITIDMHIMRLITDFYLLCNDKLQN